MFSPEKRWKEHCKDYKKEKFEKCPLYSAIRKYGIENFLLSTIEQCDDTIVNDREVYWIEYFQSFKNGYNATVGGDGKHYLDYDLICSVYEKVQNCKEVARQLNVSADAVQYVLKNRNISIRSSQEIAIEKLGKQVHMYSLNDEYIKTFSTLADAARFIIESQNKNAQLKGISTNIGRVANGKRNSAYNYKWKY